MPDAKLSQYVVRIGILFCFRIEIAARFAIAILSANLGFGWLSFPIMQHFCPPIFARLEVFSERKLVISGLRPSDCAAFRAGASCIRVDAKKEPSFHAFSPPLPAGASEWIKNKADSLESLCMVRQRVQKKPSRMRGFEEN